MQRTLRFPLAPFSENPNQWFTGRSFWKSKQSTSRQLSSPNRSKKKQKTFASKIWKPNKPSQNRASRNPPLPVVRKVVTRSQHTPCSAWDRPTSSSNLQCTCQFNRFPWPLGHFQTYLAWLCQTSPCLPWPTLPHPTQRVWNTPSLVQWLSKSSQAEHFLLFPYLGSKPYISNIKQKLG